jgi:hypothetical protein
MAGYPDIPLASGLARIFDWKNPDRESINLSRQNAQQYLAANPGDYEGMIRTFGPSMGLGADYGRILQKLDADNERKRQLLTQMQPTTETYTPQHATFGAEQMFPQAGAVPDPFGTRAEGTIGETVMDDTQYGAGRLPAGPTAALSPSTLPAPSFTGREAFQPAPGPDERADYVGGATAQTPDVTRPGLSVEEIVRNDPQMAHIATKWYPDVEKANLEQIGNRAAIQFARAVNSREMTIEAAYDKYGDQLALSPAGLKILDTYKDRLAAKKTEIQLRQDEEARTWAKGKVAELRASGDPEHARLADALEAGTQSKEFATIFHQVRELEAKRLEAAAKRTEAEKPIMVEGVPHRVIRGADGSMRLEAVPGVATPRLDQLKGLDQDSLLAIARTHPDPQMRADARAVYNELLQGKKEVSAAQGAGAVKPTQASLDRQTKLFELSDSLDAAAAAVKQHPEFIEGPASMLAAGAAKSPDLLKKAFGGLIPKGYNEFAANLDFFTATKLNELAGSALTPGEVKRYAAFLPSVWDSPAAFHAKMATAQRALAIAQKFHQKIQGGMSDAQARQETKAELQAELARAEAAQGKTPQPGAGSIPGARPGAKSFMDKTGG